MAANFSLKILTCMLVEIQAVAVIGERN